MTDNNIMTDMKKIIAYRQNGVWVVNIEGFIQTLHYTTRTKEDVRQWLKEQQEEHYYEGYEIEFE